MKSGIEIKVSKASALASQFAVGQSVFISVTDEKILVAD
jgi:hypothetical protein